MVTNRDVRNVPIKGCGLFEEIEIIFGWNIDDDQSAVIANSRSPSLSTGVEHLCIPCKDEKAEAFPS